MSTRELLISIGRLLSNMNVNDMTQAERGIAKELERHQYLELLEGPEKVFRVPLKFKKGDRVRARVDLTSDDRRLGSNNTDPIVKAGTVGVILDKSEKLCEKNHHMKSSDCWAVEWSEGVNYDTREIEMDLESGSAQRHRKAV